MTTIPAAAATAILVLLAGNLPWAGFGPITGLMGWNLRSGTGVPWAVLPAALYLWLYWRVISGRMGAEGADWRRINLRANPLPPGTWPRALAAGLVGFAALLAFLALSARLVQLPAGAPIHTPAEMPLLTGLSLIAMSSLVAGVTEEAAFRGYMQSMIQDRYGIIIAILANGTLFGLLHFSNHPADIILMLPYYIAVSAVYGGLTWATGSILPSVVLHSVGDVVVLTRWWITGLPEWQLGHTAPRLVWDTGPDLAMVLTILVCIVLAVLTTFAYRSLYRRRIAK